MTRLLVLLGVALLVALSVACGDDTCDSSSCAAGNTCIALGGETRCRKTCSSNTDPLTSCPFNYTCADPERRGQPFCVQSAALVTQKPQGQWGALCRANLGVDNPDCDRDQGFFCYGQSPGDGEAYCTRYECTADAECGPGFACEVVNQTPSVDVERRTTIGATFNVCVRRSYCSSCTSDVDCPTRAGVVSHCIEDVGGKRFCAPECTTSASCAKDAQCVDYGIGPFVCYPRAATCVGDGSLCAPCRSDADCGEDGICLKGEKTEERACGKKVADCAACPRTAPTSGAAIGCTESDLGMLPKLHCAGVYSLGQTDDLGCWTPGR